MRVFAISRDGQVTLVLGNKHYIRSGEEGTALYNAAQRYRATGLESDLQAIEDLVNPYSKYVRTGLLREKDGFLFLGESTIPMPSALAKTVTNYLDNGYPIQPLVNFWHWCLLNPNTTARDGFFAYCEQYGVTITDSGMAILYKAVTQKEDNRAADLAHFVATEWLQVKSGRKTAGEKFTPKAYGVFNKFDGFTVSLLDAGDETREDYVGNLDELFRSIQDQELEGTTVYTDKHTRTMAIKLGVPVYKPREQCDPNIHNECSYGLHVGSFQYVHSFGGNGDTVFACLVNPMNVVALPHYDSSKIRVCEYLPYAVMNREGRDWEELPSQFFEEDYHPYTVRALKQLNDQLEQALQNGQDVPGMELVREQAHIVRTKLRSIYEVTSGIDDVEVEPPVEAPFEETYFDVDDPLAINQIPTANGSGSPSDELHWFNLRGEDAWKKAVLDEGYTGSLATFMETYSEDDEDDEDYCSRCGSDDCDCGGDLMVISEEEAKRRWKHAIFDGETEESFELYCQDDLRGQDILVEGITDF